MTDKELKPKLARAALRERRLITRFLRDKCEWKDCGDRCNRAGCKPCRWASQIERRKHSSKIYDKLPCDATAALEKQK